jgi:DUF4097 and DUF4098 domain-containing protein YvlB
MSTQPPPYSPPPFGYDPRQQARFMREQMKMQARAQKAAFRAQRDLYRYQFRGYRRSSILGPFLVLAAGIIILLIRMGRIPMAQFGIWYGRWWPVLLVGAGLILVAEWAFDQSQSHTNPDGTPYVRRGIGGGAITLIIFLALSGAIVHHIDTYHDDIARTFSLDPDSIDEFFGDKHEMSEPVEAPFPVGTSFVLDNPHGNVTIVGKSDDNKVHITVNKEIFSSSDSDADSKASQLSPHISQSGTVLTVSVPWLRGGTANLDVTVPDFAETTITANQGDIAVSGLHAPVTITANHGSVELNSITGAVSARINNRDSDFVAHTVTGDVSVRGHADDMTITDVTGRVSFDGEFYGDTHMERLRGPVSFHTNRTQLNLGRLDGQLDISPKSDLTADRISGPTSLKTRSRNITFDRIAGDIDIANSDGSVDITGAPPLGNVTVQNKDGAVNLTVPEHSNFSIDADTKGGEIESDLGLKPTDGDNRSSISGAIGHGGPHIAIHTTHLDVGIHQRAVEPIAPPAPPAPPALPKPAPPTKPAPPPTPTKST